MRTNSSVVFAWLMFAVCWGSTAAAAESPLAAYFGGAIGAADVRYDHRQDFGTTPDFDDQHGGCRTTPSRSHFSQPSASGRVDLDLLSLWVLPGCFNVDERTAP